MNINDTTSKSGEGDEASKAVDEANDPNIFHKFVFMYPHELLSEPEFMFQDNLQNFTEKDTMNMLEYLQEMETLKKQRKEDDNAVNTQAATKGGKADPKKDAKGKGAKGGAPGVEDKNAPQPITVEYPTDVEEDKDYIIYEREFNAKPVPAKEAVKHTPSSSAQAIGK